MKRSKKRVERPDGIYRKVGRRYVPYGDIFDPAPGIWWVGEYDKHRFMRLGDLPTVAVRAMLERHRDAMAAAIFTQRNKPENSASDLVHAALDAVALAESGKP